MKFKDLMPRKLPFTVQNDVGYIFNIYPMDNDEVFWENIENEGRLNGIEDKRVWAAWEKNFILLDEFTDDILYDAPTTKVTIGKACSCSWDLVRRDGCHCGAIERYKGGL